MGLSFIFRAVTFAFLLFFVYLAYVKKSGFIQTEETIGTEMNLVYPPLVLCSSISALLPFLASAAIFKHSNKYSKSLVFLWIFFALSVVAEIILYILNSQKKQSAWVAPIYTLIEYVLISSVLADWQTKPAIARLMRISIPIYILFFVLINVAGLENFSAKTVNYITRPLAVLVMSTFALLSLQALWSQTPTNLAGDYRFWMLLAMSLYYSTSLGLFAFMFTQDRDLLVALLKIHAVVHIIHNILFTIGVFRVRGANQTTPQPSSAS